MMTVKIVKEQSDCNEMKKKYKGLEETFNNLVAQYGQLSVENKALLA